MSDLNNKKCIIYCRVSSKEQEERGYSLEAQEKLLTGYANKNKLEIVKVFKITESASGKQIRKTFNEMLRYIKKMKINIILCEKIDHLTRNLKDGAVISDWVMDDEKRQVHFVKENFVVSRNTRAHENLVWDMKVAIARFYTNNLSEEVKKGQKAKIEAGWLPSGYKFGYKTIGEKGHKIQVVDKTYAAYVKKIFKLYKSGNYTIKRIVEEMYKQGLRSKNGNKVGHNTTHKILSDTFYIGLITWNGKEYQGKQERIIDESLFYDVQRKLKRKIKGKQFKTHNHIFKGLIRCAKCGCLITWETQKGHHYGRCKNYKPCKQKGYVREDGIEDTIFESLQKIKPNSQKVLDWINKALKETNKSKTDYTSATRENLNNALKTFENRIDKIYIDKLDEIISEEYYQKKFKEFSDQKKETLSQLNKMENNVQNYYEIGMEIHDLAFNAQRLYNSPKASPDDKRTLLSKFFTNMKLEDKKLAYEFKPAYKLLSEWMPKLNATSELLKQTEDYKKTGAFAPAHPIVLGDRDLNPDTQDQNLMSYH